MMTRTLIAHVNPGEAVCVSGFVEHIRNKRAMAFLVLRDRSGKIQVTVEKEKHPAIAEAVDSLTLESVVRVEGDAVANDHVKLGGIEVIPRALRVESLAEPLPIQEDSSIDLRLDYRWLDLRGEKNKLIFQVQTAMADAFRGVLLEEGFTEIHSPKLISAASESGADVFELEYFGGKAYLAQSPQFYKQMAMAAGFERVFECGPVFRAEKSHTNKHATEFTGFDLEMSYIDSFHDVMLLEERMMRRMLETVKTRCGDDLKRLWGVEVTVPAVPFPVMTLGEVYGELNKRYGYSPPESNPEDLTTEAEQLCERLAKDMYGHEFLFVTGYGAGKRAFYHMRDENGVPLGYDLLWKGIEITTGAQREHRYDILKRQADERGLGEDVRHYLEFFKYGCPPHGGFGMGLDRITMVTMNIAIKEAMFLFRGPNRLTP
jgi:aspartyl-tRNA synthetase